MAASMLTAIVLMSLSLHASALQFDVHPTRIEVGLSTSFYLSCSYNHGADPTMSSLVSIFVSHAKFIDQVFHEIASIDTFSGSITDMAHDNATISGVINNQGLSFLTMEWKYPDDEVSGIYECIANGVDRTGHPMSVMSTSQVTSEIPDTKQLVQVVHNLMMNMDNVLDNICISGCWQNRLDQMMKARFEISSLYYGRRYLLSKYANQFSHSQAGESCELYGGYLVEIDDEQELMFIKSFIKAHKGDYRIVLIAGTDEVQQGRWVFERSGRVMTYTKYVQGFPVDLPNFDCNYLYGDYDWDMADHLCLEVERIFKPRYMCELPQ